MTQRENLKIKTIKIELLEGIPSGFRRAEFTTQLMRVLVVPRDRQELLEHCPEAKFQAVYLIVGENDEGEPQVYIGKTRRMALRINEHNKGGKKDYWKNVLYFVTKDNSLSSTEIEYLEWLLIQKATETGNFQLINGNKGCKEEPQVEPAKRSDFADYYNQIVALTEVLGYGDIFNVIHIEASDNEIYYYCNARGADARMIVRDDGYYIQAESICASALTESGRKERFIPQTRDKLLKNNVLRKQDNGLIFLQEHKFKSPSGAAGVISGTASNGWTTWKDPAGKTLDECVRQKST